MNDVGANPRLAPDPALLSRRFGTLPTIATSKHHEWIRKLDEKAATSKEQYAVHFRDKYPDSAVPIWVAVELQDFGPLSHFLSGLRTTDLWAIARKYSVPRPELLSRWVRTFCDVRNVCAHHARLWNKPLVNEPLPPKPKEIPMLEHLIGEKSAQSRIYGAAAVGRYMLRSINPTSTWGDRLKAQVETFPKNDHVAAGAMGMPPGWNSLDLWQ
jgi:abortive infection bacteriophage resistance protein